jgi:DNA-binding ferritin-like protein
MNQCKKRGKRMKKTTTPNKPIPAILKTYGQIDSYLKFPIELLQKAGDDEQASILVGIQKNYNKKIFDYLRENNLQKIQINLSSTNVMTYSLVR